MADTPVRPDIISAEEVDTTTGQKSILVKTAGATDSSGNPAISAVVDGNPFGASQDREYVGAAATRQKFTWPTGTGPTSIDVRVYTAAASANLPLEAISVTFDAESDAVADANIAQTGGVAADMQNTVVQVQDGWVRFNFTTPLERMDYKVETATVSAVRVRAV